MAPLRLPSWLDVRRLPPYRQDVVNVLGTFTVGVLLYLSGIYALSNHGTGVPLWARVAVLAAASVVHLLRRRAPGLGLALVLVPLAVDAALGISAPIWVVFGDLAYAATLHGSARLSRAMIPIAALSTAAIVATGLLLAANWRSGVLAGIASAPFLLVPVWWGANIRQHRDLAERERANAAQLAQIAELDRRAAVTAERGRMARDLHDVIAGHLSAIALQSAAALSMAGTAPGPVRSVLDSVRANSVEALEEMRTMIGLLRADGEPETAAAPARLADLGKLVESARASGLDVRTDAELGDRPLPASVDLAAYRIAQEALTNAARHSPGSAVTVTVRRDDSLLTVRIVNDLKGSVSSNSDGAGISNMRERAAAVGGTLSAGPDDGQWLVSADLPTEGR